MKYRKLNEVLIEWNESSKEDSENIFLQSKDIKEYLDKCFIYKLNEKDLIKIFDADWPELKKYKDKVWINGKHVKLDNHGWTVDIFEPGEYKVYIEDINKVTDMTWIFCNCKQLVSAFIPNSVTSIGSSAFGYCSGLTNITIPNSVTSVGTLVFCGCTGLKSVTIPDSVTFIGSYAFEYCTSLTSITIPNSVTEIGWKTFNDCTNLTSITIGNSVKFIGDGAFKGCKNLKTVYVEDINKFKQIQFEGEQSNPARTKKVKVIELKNRMG